MSLVAIGVVVSVCSVAAIAGVIVLYRKRILSKIVADEKNKRNQQSIREKSLFTSSLRGNLVRTYHYPIEQDFIIHSEKELGKGGVGVVYVGERKDNGEYYAVKYVNKIAYEREVVRLDREMKLLKDVDHTNIVRLFSVYDLPEQMFFVMELCSGGHLGNLLARQPQKRLDEAWAKRLCLQLVSAVNHMHSKGICHRDIKTQNILLDHSDDYTAQIKLIDFGYGAKYIGNLPMRTKCGTPYTTAPEVFRECYDERCDVWSIGVVLYIMLSGRRPFETVDVPGGLKEAGRAAMIANILAGRYHFNHASFRTVSDSAKTFVQKLLEVDYRKRMTSAHALQNPWLRNKESNRLELDTKLLNISNSTKGSRAINNMKISMENTSKNIIMMPLVFSLNTTQTKELRALFQTFNRDSSGSLSREEFRKAMNVMSPDLNRTDIDQLFDIIDIDGSGSISYTEFLAATLDPRGIDIEQLNEAFNLMDSEGKGYITFEDIHKMLDVETEEYKAMMAKKEAEQSQPHTPSYKRLKTNPSSPSASKFSSGRNKSSRTQIGKLSPTSSKKRLRLSSYDDSVANYKSNRLTDNDRDELRALAHSPTMIATLAATRAAAALGLPTTMNPTIGESDKASNPSRRYSKSIVADNITPKASRARLGSEKCSSVREVDDELRSNDDDEYDLMNIESKNSLTSRILDMIKLYDKNDDGVISYDEFLWALAGAADLFVADITNNSIFKCKRYGGPSQVFRRNTSVTMPQSPRYSNKSNKSVNNSHFTISMHQDQQSAPMTMHQSPISTKNHSNKSNKSAYSNHLSMPSYHSHSTESLKRLTSSHTQLMPSISNKIISTQDPELGLLGQGNFSPINEGRDDYVGDNVIPIDPNDYSPTHSSESQTPKSKPKELFLDDIPAERDEHRKDNDILQRQSCDMTYEESIENNISLQSTINLSYNSKDQISGDQETDSKVIRSPAVARASTLLKEISGIIFGGSSKGGDSSKTPGNFKGSGKRHAVLPYSTIGTPDRPDIENNFIVRDDLTDISHDLSKQSWLTSNKQPSSSSMSTHPGLDMSYNIHSNGTAIDDLLVATSFTDTGTFSKTYDYKNRRIISTATSSKNDNSRNPLGRMSLSSKAQSTAKNVLN